MSTQQATLHVSGMTCNNCTRFVDNTLRDLTGVETTNVSLENGTAQVKFNTNLLDPTAHKWNPLRGHCRWIFQKEWNNPTGGCLPTSQARRDNPLHFAGRWQWKRTPP